MRASGNCTQILVNPDLPKYKSNDRTKASLAELAATVSGSVANFGTWSVDEATKTLTYHIRGSTYPHRRRVDRHNRPDYQRPSVGDDLEAGEIGE